MDFNEILNEVIEEEKVEEQRRKEIIVKGIINSNKRTLYLYKK